MSDGDDVRIPARLHALRRYDGGAAWLEALPRTVRECVERWGLTLGESFANRIAYVNPVCDGASACWTMTRMARITSDDSPS